jgi:sedoheptulokinase
MGESIVLGLDLGTTAVKAVLLRVQASGGGEPELLASSTRVTEAYCVDPSGPFKREQDPLRILEAVRQALLGLPHALLASASACGLCDQMHGCLLWSAADPVGTATRLVTWEDGRCDPSFLASKNAALSSSIGGGASGPVFSGYGCATLAWLLEHEPGWFEGRDCAGTIGSWVTAVALLGPPPPPRVPLDPTDAASWGAASTPSAGSGRRARPQRPSTLPCPRGCPPL